MFHANKQISFILPTYVKTVLRVINMKLFTFHCEKTGYPFRKKFSYIELFVRNITYILELFPIGQIGFKKLLLTFYTNKEIKT